MAVLETEVVWPLSGAARPARAGAPAVVGVADLRATNAAAVLAVVRSADPHPRLSELVKATRLSRPTVEAIAEELADRGLIEVASALPSRGQRSPGRPARRFRFRPHAGFVVGVDVRARSVTACLADLDGEPVAVEHRPVRADLTGPARAKAVTAVIRAAMARADVDARLVWAATVGTPGLVGRDNTRIRQADNLRTWAEVDIVGILRDDLGCPVAVENDANLAALGEQWRGVGRAAPTAGPAVGESGAPDGTGAPGGGSPAPEGDAGEPASTGPPSGPAGGATGGADSQAGGGDSPAGGATGGAGSQAGGGAAGGEMTGEMVFVLLGERLGAGVITGGRLLRGHHGAAGEIGFIRFPGGSTPGLDPLPADTIANAASGDCAAVAAVESYGHRLAEGIVPVLLALDPAIVVLGTGQFPGADLLPAAGLLLSAAQRRADDLLVDPPRWHLSALADDAVLTGAVRFALSSVEVVLRTRPTSLAVRA